MVNKLMPTVTDLQQPPQNLYEPFSGLWESKMMGNSWGKSTMKRNFPAHVNDDRR